MRRFCAIVMFATGIALVNPVEAMDTSSPPAKGIEGKAFAPPLPGQRDELIAYVVHALNTHDLDAIDRLVCQSALEWDPSCCRISECYPHSAIVLVDATSKYRPRQVAFPACSARGAVGGAGPT